MIAPASPFPLDDFERGVARLGERYRVTYRHDITARRGFLAGDDGRRARELEEALADPSVDAIVAARGGYGVTPLLRHFVPENVRAANKLLVGFSDLSALHALWARAGLRSIHGPMVCGLGRAAPNEVERWIATVEGAAPAPIAGLERVRGGTAEGPLLGGNLALMAALVGTPHAPPVEGAVLFLEDVGEAPYRVDRMLTTLREAGWLDRIAAVALGGFTDCGPRNDGRTVEEVLHERLGALGIPVVSGVPSGHLADNLPLPFGAPARLDADRGTLTSVEPAVL